MEHFGTIEYTIKCTSGLIAKEESLTAHHGMDKKQFFTINNDG